MQPRLFTPSYCCILAANFLLYFGFWLLIPLLPFYLLETYKLSESSIGIILSLYTVSALLVRPFSGYLLDTFSRKPLYLLSYALFTFVFLGYIVGGTLVLFVLLRIVHGFTFGTVTVGGNTIVIDIMPAERRGEGLGYYGLTNNIALSIGPMVGLLLHNRISYEWIFTIGLLACILGFVLAASVHVPRKVLIKQKQALSLDRFFLTKSIPASIALLLLSIPYGAATNFVAMYVEELHLPVTSGYYFVLMALGMGISRIFSGKYVDKGYVTECIRHGLTLVILAFTLLGSCGWFISVSLPLTETLFFIVPVLQGVGFGIIFPAYNTLYINLAQHNQRATATSSYLTSWDVGLGIGMLLSGVIAQLYDWSMVYLVGAVLSLVSTLYFINYVTPHYQKNKLR